MEAGSDTTSSTLLSFVLAVIQQPEILKKAQTEIDAVCGTDRSPTPDDLSNLPYLKACMTEVCPLSPKCTTVPCSGMQCGPVSNKDLLLRRFDGAP